VEKRGDRAFGEAVRGLRERRELSQERLGELSRLHRNYIGGIERGELNPTLKTIKKLAAALELTPSRLLAAAERLERAPAARSPRKR
jgi:transcriptional regulator with XRE-family HTH domain